MEHSRIVELLKANYDFRENHVLILKALEIEDLTADEVCQATKIPKGRIYDFLNFLLEKNIIVTNGKHPKAYSFKSVSENVREFLQIKFQQTVKDEAHIKSMLNLEEKKIIPINSSQDLIPLLRKILESRNKFNIITQLHPHLFYSNDDAIFSRFSKYLMDIEFSMSANNVVNFLIKNAFWDAYYRNEEFIYVIDDDVIADYKNTLRRLFSKEEAVNILQSIKALLEKGIVKIYVSRVKNPYYMVITETEVLLVMIAKRSIEGALIVNNEIADVYQKMFLEQISKSENLLEKWDKVFE